MRLAAFLLVAACCAAFAPPVSADVRVTFSNGRVTVVATDATVSEILAEWSRVGGSTFVDADKIPSTDRLTIRLEDERELDALEVLLRSVAGYMVTPVAGSPAGVSVVNRVFILPTSTPVEYLPPPASLAADNPGDAVNPRRSAGPPQPDDDGPVRIATPPPLQTPQAAAPQAPLGQAGPLLNGAPTQTMPGLGVVTSSQPGVAIPAGTPVRRRPTTQPTQPIRPGGGGGGGDRR